MPALVSRIVDVYVFRRTASGIEFLQLHRRPESRIGGTWQAVHGKIEAAETAVQAAKRELAEETGLTPLGFWQLEHVNTFFVAEDDAIHLCAGFAAEVATDAAVRIDDEHDAFRWVASAEAEKTFMWPGQRQGAREILESIIDGGASEPFLRLSP
jgi:dihydroneopterin triphosphate diphosphatase